MKTFIIWPSHLKNRAAAYISWWKIWSSNMLAMKPECAAHVRTKLAFRMNVGQKYGMFATSSVSMYIG